MSGNSLWAKAVFILITLLAVQVASAADSKTLDHDVTIGVLTDMSSVYSDLVGAGSVLAAQMAVDDFIKAQHPDYKIHVISADHHSKAAVASSIARDWIDKEGVNVITDVSGASVTLAVSALGAQKNTLVLATASGQTSLSGKDCQATTLHWTYNIPAVSGTTARVVTRQGKKNWFFLTADYAGGDSMRDDAASAVKANGGKVIGSLSHPLGNRDFSSALLMTQDPKIDVVGLANAGNDTINAIKQANEYGITSQKTIVPLLMFITDVDTLGLEMTQDMYVTAPFYWGLNESTRAWSKRFLGEHGRMPTMVQAGLYSSVLHYLKAVDATGSTDTETVNRKMHEMPVNDMFVENGRIRQDNLMVHNMYVFRIKKPSESQYPWDYYQLVETLSPEEAYLPLSKDCSLVK